VLILSRKPGDAIVIDSRVRVVVLSADRRGVRLGIEAPPEVRILRSEILSEVAAENHRATATGREWLDLVPAQPSTPTAAGAREPS
jgi:carbon storage regulator